MPFRPIYLDRRNFIPVHSSMLVYPFLNIKLRYFRAFLIESTNNCAVSITHVTLLWFRL